MKFIVAYFGASYIQIMNRGKQTMGIEWLDTSQQATYNETENVWVQPVSWRTENRILHAEVFYDYKTQAFDVSTPYEEKGLFEPIMEEKDEQMRAFLLADDRFTSFLRVRKTMFDALKPVLVSDDWGMTNVVIKKSSDFLKEITFSLGDNAHCTAYVEKQVDWSLSTLIARVGVHTLHPALRGTNAEKKIEAQLLSHIFM